MLSVPHLIIIFVVALVVFGPEKLPELARNLGKVMSEFRRATGDIRSTFEEHLRDLEREADDRRIGGSSQTVRQPEALPPSSAPPNAVAATSPSARFSEDAFNEPRTGHYGDPGDSGWAPRAGDASPEVDSVPPPPASGESFASVSPRAESESPAANGDPKSETVNDGHS
ncbi:MAG TPA: twin-arginine translocase TatA/TatE family subunit [Candidatus Acidoferrales bacterium]|nr:twin-arginine translocase TatA/TatE family subunit [Candidatus Acidoferrales bacterium]